MTYRNWLCVVAAVLLHACEANSLDGTAGTCCVDNDNATLKPGQQCCVCFLTSMQQLLLNQWTARIMYRTLCCMTALHGFQWTGMVGVPIAAHKFWCWVYAMQEVGTCCVV
jgi:hypothetical protein